MPRAIAGSQGATFDQPIDFLEKHPPALFSAVVRQILVLAGGDVGDCGGVWDADQLAPTNTQWDETWLLLKKHRVGTFVPFLLRSEVLVLEPAAAEAVRTHARFYAALHLSLRVQARETTEFLAAEGIDCRVLKGLATAALDHPEQLMRRTTDVDLLVRPQDFERARAVLAATGASELKPDAGARVLVETTFRAESGIELDIHHRLFRFGQVADDLLFDSPVELPESMGLAMPVEARLMHAACHLLLSAPGHRLGSSLVDVAVIQAADELDLDAAFDLADQFGVRDVVRFACWLAGAISAPGRPSREIPGPPAIDRTLLNQAFLRVDRSVPIETAATLFDLEGLANKLGFLRYQATKLRSESA